MAVCNIRNIDASLLRRMKIRAVEEGLTLRDWCIRAFVRALEVRNGIHGTANEAGGTESKRVHATTGGRELPTLPEDRGDAVSDQGAEPVYVVNAKCFCGAKVFQGVTKWKCEKGHWSTPEKETK